ncbi:malonic semialdehyde reductase [Acidisoma silvae]|uniref:Malonic semialdehyde reductase n=1 Tax=Acidisoma silvae TaxID=2802396 RepID=A0A963YR88_9PROT|nr:malonic semialdehyde reductase [Acidisoma silvae]MCB8875530.1 malonic semialdehyde reductase [Acidisoma silvae]
MTDVTETNDKLTAEDAVPAHAPASVAAPAHDASLADRLIAEDIAIPGEAAAVAVEDSVPEVIAAPAEPKTFPYDLESPELARAFLDARTPSAWTDRAIDEETYRHLYDLVKLGPTSANTSPLRLVFVRSPGAKERLRTALTPANVEAVMTAPVTVIVAFDPSFYDFLTRLYPQADARPWFAWNDDFSQETAMRNGSLQGGYLIMAARLLGLDCWPMSGFDNARVDALFLDGRGWRSNFLLSLGYAEPAKTGRNTRLMFEETCEVI